MGINRKILIITYLFATLIYYIFTYNVNLIQYETKWNTKKQIVRITIVSPYVTFSHLFCRYFIVFNSGLLKRPIFYVKQSYSCLYV